LRGSLPDKVLDVLVSFKSISKEENVEQQVLISFLFFLLNSPVGENFSAKEKKAIEKTYQGISIHPEIKASIERYFADINDEWWGFSVEWDEDDD